MKIKYVSMALFLAIIFYYDTLLPHLAIERAKNLSGTLYDICAPIEKLDEMNKNISPILNEIIETPFFMTYKINMETECPFWA